MAEMPPDSCRNAATYVHLYTCRSQALQCRVEQYHNNMKRKIELTDKQAQVLYYVLDRVNRCLEKDYLFGGTLYHDNGSFLCQLEPSEKRSLDRIIEKMSK